MKLIEEKGALTDELIQSIFLAESKEELEDIYKPFKENRKTRKSAAIDLGFENARNLVYENKSQEEIIEECLKTASENDLTLEEGLNFVTDIIRGDISEDFSIKKYIRDRAMYTGLVVSEKNKDTENFTYESYYDFKSKIRSIKAHQVLALKRGEKEEALKVDLKLEDDANLDYIRGKYIVDKNDFNREIIEKALIDSYKTLILPSIKNEIWSILKEEADKKSILIFKENLKPYLMQRPLKKRAVIGLDPGFRTGCKVAVISCYGDYLDSAVIHVTEPKKDTNKAMEIINNFVEKYDAKVIALGNGTASRETEEFINNFIDLRKAIGHNDISYAIVSESGASIYSASKIGIEEFPDLDVTIRGAISIARRLLDPLSELVKIEPKHIGVGQYQHDVSEKMLDEALEGVVEACVNEVGVDINSASYSLLSHVSGISKSIAENIEEYRKEVGSIKSKNELKKVKGIGPKTFEQAAGFIRIRNAEDLLDNTGIHPESYDIARLVLKEDLEKEDWKDFAEKNNAGYDTLLDIVKELRKPGLDPRDELEEVVLKKGIVSIDDLEKGMALKGTIRNVLDFGAFIDIGVGVDGLCHISEMSDKFINHPLDLVKVSQVVDVKILDVDKEKNRISLTMR